MGSSRPSRPGQLDQQLADNLAGGLDPQAVSEMSHASAAALLNQVHASQDPTVVQRVLKLVDVEGVDIIAQLWSDADPDSLPGVLWRLYLLRTWMQRDQDAIAALWRLGEPEASTASAIAGIDQTPGAEDISRTADSILSGAFTGDFAVALDRAGAFTEVIAYGLRMEAKRVAHEGRAKQGSESTAPHAEHSTSAVDHDGKDLSDQTRAARIMHRAANLDVTAKTFIHGADLWRRGKLE
ncbi:hypothetical protein [Bifidobacterium aemilianum]|uniref:hypothetical protein n=1 Tax=Bifidobacterium aemilianum TaxID=2493120 RepID=UPI00191C47B3|nr:hypothetical protein [Bifidobacterium aemilianum]